jgi:hypothetical protein
LVLLTGIQIWMRLHEVHPIHEAKSMAIAKPRERVMRGLTATHTVTGTRQSAPHVVGALEALAIHRLKDIVLAIGASPQVAKADV